MFENNEQIASEIRQFAKDGYSRLENTMALIKLLQQRNNIDKETEITLNMVLSDIKSTIENILQIQDVI